MTQDDRQAMRSFYDELGDAEWDRCRSRPIHLGTRGIGARILVTDFSPVQLDLNQTRLDGVTSVESCGMVVASVMSLLGTWRHLLEDTIIVAETFGDDANDAVINTGDLRYIGGEHICQMFRSRDITELVERCGGKVLAMSASNWAFLDNPEVLARLETNADRWRRFLDHEVAACGEPGASDGGMHLLFAAQRK